MNVRLVVEQGARRKVMNLKPPEAVLGRAHGNTVRIPSAEVSRQHCRLRLEDGLVTLEDLDSINGTFLNGRRVQGSEVVRPGDNLEVGPVTFTVEYELTPEALARLRGKDADADVEVDILEALADGDVDELPVLDEPDDLPVLDEDEDEVLPVIDSDEPVKPDFDFDSQWQAPGGGELRDILSHMEDEDPPTQHRSPKKRR